MCICIHKYNTYTCTYICGKYGIEEVGSKLARGPVLPLPLQLFPTLSQPPSPPPPFHLSLPSPPMFSPQPPPLSAQICLPLNYCQLSFPMTQREANSAKLKPIYRYTYIQYLGIFTSCNFYKNIDKYIYYYFYLLNVHEKTEK